MPPCSGFSRIESPNLSMYACRISRVALPGLDAPADVGTGGAGGGRGALLDRLPFAVGTAQLARQRRHPLRCRLGSPPLGHSTIAEHDARRTAARTTHAQVRTLTAHPWPRGTSARARWSTPAPYFDADDHAVWRDRVRLGLTSGAVVERGRGCRDRTRPGTSRLLTRRTADADFGVVADDADHGEAGLVGVAVVELDQGRRAPGGTGGTRSSRSSR